VEKRALPALGNQDKTVLYQPYRPAAHPANAEEIDLVIARKNNISNIPAS